MALSQCIGVSGYGCYSSCKVSIVILDSFAFINSALSSASADNSAKKLSIWHRMNIATLRCMGYLSCGFHPRDEFPDPWILSYLADK